MFTRSCMATAALITATVGCGDDASPDADVDGDVGGGGTGQEAPDDRTSPEGGNGSASAVLEGPDGSEVGEVHFRESGNGTRVTVEVSALDGEAGFRGFHIHANDDSTTGEGCSADPDEPSDTWFESADGHLDGERTHPDHQGDMPSLLLSEDGTAYADFLTDRFSPDDVTDAAVIIHADPDNFGNVPVGDDDEDYTPNDPAATELTEDTGNAGDRVACGVVQATETTNSENGDT